MQRLEDRDFFTDHEILVDPYSYFDAIRALGPVYQPPGRDYVMVTGSDELLEVMKNNRDFSSIIALQGAAAPLPFQPEGADIAAEIEANRPKFLGGDLLVNYDDQRHAFSRALLSRLFTPSRLRANEKFISEYSEQLVRDAVANGGVELIKTISTPS